MRAADRSLRGSGSVGGRGGLHARRDIAPGAGRPAPPGSPGRLAGGVHHQGRCPGARSASQRGRRHGPPGGHQRVGWVAGRRGRAVRPAGRRPGRAGRGAGAARRRRPHRLAGCDAGRGRRLRRVPALQRAGRHPRRARRAGRRPPRHHQAGHHREDRAGPGHRGPEGHAPGPQHPRRAAARGPLPGDAARPRVDRAGDGAPAGPPRGRGLRDRRRAHRPGRRHRAVVRAGRQPRRLRLHVHARPPAVAQEPAGQRRRRPHHRQRRRRPQPQLPDPLALRRRGLVTAAGQRGLPGHGPRLGAGGPGRRRPAGPGGLRVRRQLPLGRRAAALRLRLPGGHAHARRRRVPGAGRRRHRTRDPGLRPRSLDRAVHGQRRGDRARPRRLRGTGVHARDVHVPDGERREPGGPLGAGRLSRARSTSPTTRR